MVIGFFFISFHVKGTHCWFFRLHANAFYDWQLIPSLNTFQFPINRRNLCWAQHIVEVINLIH
jgi:hypothetical protein